MAQPQARPRAGRHPNRQQDAAISIGHNTSINAPMRPSAPEKKRSAAASTVSGSVSLWDLSCIGHAAFMLSDCQRHRRKFMREQSLRVSKSNANQFNKTRSHAKQDPGDVEPGGV